MSTVTIYYSALRLFSPGGVPAFVEERLVAETAVFEPRAVQVAARGAHRRKGPNGLRGHHCDVTLFTWKVQHRVLGRHSVTRDVT